MKSKTCKMKKFISLFMMSMLVTASCSNMYARELISGSMGQYITRGEVVEALGKGLDVKAEIVESNFKDINGQDEYAPYIGWAEKLGIIHGRSKGTFAPNAEMTREEFAVLLANYMQAMGMPFKEAEFNFKDQDVISSWSSEAITQVVAYGFMKESEGLFAPKALVTAAEGTEILKAFTTSMVAQKSLDAAYKQQVVWMNNQKKAIGGYKAGFTAKAQQDKFGISEPIYAPLFSEGQIKDGHILLEQSGIMLETEIAFKLNKDITGPIADVETLKSYIESVHMAVEVPLMNMDPATMTAPSVVAGGIGSYRYIIGEELPMNEDLDALSVKLLKDDDLIYEAKGSEAMGAQWEAALWLVNAITAQEGYALYEGEYLLTGALGQMTKAEEGSYTVQYGENNQLSFEVSK